MRTLTQKYNAQNKTAASDNQNGKAYLPSNAAPVNTILSLQGKLGNRSVQKLLSSKTIQAKLEVGEPDDIYEKEADSIADKVIRMPEPPVQPKPG
jgi:hypothetical protein